MEINEIKVRKFATACYEMNGLDELNDAINFEADAIDCYTWGLTVDEWHKAISLAISWKLRDQ